MDTTPTGRAGYEASVQLLTAEVRTLVVGSRQVTMSVFNQLDTVPPDEIDPFGRVNQGTPGNLWVVGRRRVDGALVASFVPRRAASIEDDGYVYVRLAGSNVWSSRTGYRYWRLDLDAGQQRSHLAGLVEQWTALPLIVLAGLR